MQRATQSRIARRLGIASAAVILICAVVLIADHLVAMARADSEKSRVDELVEQIKTDATIAESLHGEREQQTNVSITRKTRNRALAWLLLVAGGVFVASGKWYMSTRSQPLPTLDELVAVRFPSSTSSPGKVQALAASSEGPAIDLAFVDELVARFGREREAAIPILQAIQTHYRYLPDATLQRVCELTEITPAQIAGSSSFYAQFRRSPVGRYVVRVCHGTACHVAGAEQIDQELRRHLEIPQDEDTDARRLFTLDAVACVGCCSLAPVIMIENETAGRLTPASARQVLDELASRT
jgi:NADH:ubiquinone oxidoreductase subunit E